MRHHIPESKVGSLRLFTLFCLLVSVLLLMSLTAKLVALIQKSNFAGNSHFILAVAQKKTEKPVSKEVTLYSFQPYDQSITVVHVSGISNLQQTGKLLKIPVDGVIASKEEDISDHPVSEQLRSFFLHYIQEETNLTILDIGRLWVYTKNVPVQNITEKEVSLSRDLAGVDTLMLDKQMAQLFADERILKEKMSIQIVNAASVNGLGNRLGRMLSNMGGNVVSVITEDTQQTLSEISYTGEKTYTVERLSNVLGYKATSTEKQGISDIVITLGKDSENAQAF